MLLIFKSDKMNLEVEGNFDHVANMGRMVERLESRLRANINDLYFGRMEEVMDDLRCHIGLTALQEKNELRRKMEQASLQTDNDGALTVRKKEARKPKPEQPKETEQQPDPQANSHTQQEHADESDDSSDSFSDEMRAYREKKETPKMLSLISLEIETLSTSHMPTGPFLQDLKPNVTRWDPVKMGICGHTNIHHL